MGAAIRDLRAASGLTGKELAAKLGWSQSRISKVETGVSVPSFEDVAAITAALSAPPEVAEPLLEHAKHLSTQRRTWRQWHAQDVVHHQRRFRELEEGSELIRNYQHTNIPGLLQTAEYARQVFLRSGAGIAERDLDAAVARRMERQKVLFSPGKQLHFVMAEAALRLRITSTMAMLAQLDRLISLVALEHVTIGVVPWLARLEVIPLGSMVIFDNKAVMMETNSAELILEDEADVALYVSTYERVMGSAMFGSDAATFLRSLFQEVADRWGSGEP